MFEGSACCPDGTWTCSIGDATTFPCDGVNLVVSEDEFGEICQDEDACCDTSERPLCFEGSACCPDGTWTCSIGDARTFPCDGVNLVVAEDEFGEICEEVDVCCDPSERPDGGDEAVMF